MIFLVSLGMFLDIYANKYTITLQPPRLFLFWLLSFPSSRIKARQWKGERKQSLKQIHL